ncbi:MAG: hypothetical protein WB716_06010, partial [Candidatus Acidiferrales bacterium]
RWWLQSSATPPFAAAASCPDAAAAHISAIPAAKITFKQEMDFIAVGEGCHAPHLPASLSSRPERM